VTRAVDALGGEAEQGLVTTDADAAAKAEQRGNAQHVRRFCFVDRGRVSTRGSRKETECMRTIFEFL
jgi:hypothetical protein